LSFSVCLAPAWCGASSTGRTGTGQGCGQKYFLFGRILWPAPNVTAAERDDDLCIARNQQGASMMKRTLIRYRTKPELADQNAALIAAVFAELKAAKPEGVRYLSLRVEDGTFVHFVETEADAAGVLTNLAAFKAFQSGIRERCIEPPQPGSAIIVGNYRMLNEP
jgi:hypothetical protein